MSREERLAEAARAIRGAGKLALACHIGPDGDALGSMLALGLGARDAGKDVVASFGSPFVVAGSLAFMPGLDLLVKPAEFPKEPETMVVLDTASLERLGELAAHAGKAETLVVVDHHVTNEGFGDVALVDGDVAATGELVYELFGHLGWEITTEVASCLLAALITDTGRFQYSNTTPATLRAAAELMVRGAIPAHISHHVYERAPFGYLKAAALALGRAQLDENLGVVSTIVTLDDLKKAGVDWAEMDNLIDLVRLAEEADVAILAKVHGDGRVKISLRSRGQTDVGSLAAAMGGGGHRLAAGFTVAANAGELIDKIRGMVPDYR